MNTQPNHGQGLVGIVREIVERAFLAGLPIPEATTIILIERKMFFDNGTSISAWAHRLATSDSTVWSQIGTRKRSRNRLYWQVFMGQARTEQVLGEIEKEARMLERVA